MFAGDDGTGDIYRMYKEKVEQLKLFDFLLENERQQLPFEHQQIKVVHKF